MAGSDIRLGVVDGNGEADGEEAERGSGEDQENDDDAGLEPGVGKKLTPI